MTYKTKGVCSQLINFEIDENNKLHNVSFLGGCDGNLKGISKLVEGMDCEEVAALLEGTDCGGKGTSCPDQLSRAIRAALQ